MRYTLALVFLACTATHAYADDAVETMFTEAQGIALEILNAVPPKLFDASLLPEAEFRDRIEAFYHDPKNGHAQLLEEARAFLHEERIAIKGDVSPVPLLRIVKQNANGACGQTQLHRFAPVTISSQRAEVEIFSVGDAAKLLIGEYVHHLGKGNEFADWIKLVVIESFKKHNPKRYDDLFTISDDYEPKDKQQFIKEHLGKVYLFPDAENPAHFIMSTSGGLVFDVPDRYSPDIEQLFIAVNPIRWDIKKKSFVTSVEWVINGRRAKAWRYDAAGQPVKGIDGKALYERFPVSFRKHFDLEFKFMHGGDTVRVTFPLPTLVDLERQQFAIRYLTRSYVTQPGGDIIHAWTAKLRKKNEESARRRQQQNNQFRR